MIRILWNLIFHLGHCLVLSSCLSFLHPQHQSSTAQYVPKYNLSLCLHRQPCCLLEIKQIILRSFEFRSCPFCLFELLNALNNIYICSSVPFAQHLVVIETSYIFYYGCSSFLWSLQTGIYFYFFFTSHYVLLLDHFRSTFMLIDHSPCLK